MPITSTDPAIRLFAANKRHAWSRENVDNAVRVIERTKAWLIAHGTTLLDADRLLLQEYLNDRLENGRWRGKPLSPNSIIVEHRQLRAFYGWAAEDHGDVDPLIIRNPMRGVSAPKAVDPEPSSTPVITEAQYRSLLGACAKRKPANGRAGRSANARRDAAILALMWSTGGRRGEISAVRLADVNWDTQTVHFARTKGRGKTKSRDCYFDDEALDFLTRYVMERGDHEGPLFESRRYLPGADRRRIGISPNTITNMLRRRVVEAGLDCADYDWAGAGFGAHAFRRAYSTAWLDAGGAVRDLETNNGWKHDGRMAAHYTRAAESQQAAAEAKRIAEVRRSRRPLRAVG